MQSLTPLLREDVAMQLGTIKKLVLVPSALPAGEAVPDEGYGIIHGRDGQDVYFVNWAVRGCRFDELSSGQNVRYTVEEGPLGRAATVLPMEQR